MRWAWEVDSRVWDYCKVTQAERSILWLIPLLTVPHQVQSSQHEDWCKRKFNKTPLAPTPASAIKYCTTRDSGIRSFVPLD